MKQGSLNALLKIHFQWNQAHQLGQKIERIVCLLVINKFFDKDEAKKYFKHRRVIFALTGGIE